MGNIKSIGQLVDAELNGQMREYVWRKTPSQATTAGLWFDLSLSPGNPPPQYYVGSPLTATALRQSTDGGLWHGAAVSNSEMYLRKILALTATATALPMSMILCDYLLFYPFIDTGTTDPQSMVNTVALPRYTDGKGVQVIAVQTNAGAGGQSFSFSYTNSNGVAGRTSQTITMNTATTTGTIFSNSIASNISANCFCGLQSGDSGVRSIESITMNGLDFGLFALVLVKPIGYTQIRGIDSPVEKDMLVHSFELERVYDDAFLSFLCLPNGALNATALIGTMKVVWA